MFRFVSPQKASKWSYKGCPRISKLLLGQCPSPNTLAFFILQLGFMCVPLYNVGADAELNKRGIQAVEEVLKEARRLARGLPPEKREAIEKICTEIEALMKELAELQAKGEVRERGRGRGRE